MNSDLNPMGISGIAFIEIVASNLIETQKKLSFLGFKKDNRRPHPEGDIYSQGNINILLSYARSEYTSNYLKQHGTSISGIGFRFIDPEAAFQLAVSKGAEVVLSHILSVRGVGDSLIYFIDMNDNYFPYKQAKSNIHCIDHLAVNVKRGSLDRYVQFFKDVFNFKEINMYDIEGNHTAFRTCALISPCESIRLPINESKDDVSQIEEFLEINNGEGIQHVAFGTEDIFSAVNALRKGGVNFMNTPDSYYAGIDRRCPNHNENISLLKKTGVLLDASPDNPEKKLLQIFTGMMFGGAFVELIQRKGNSGFGGGNIKALFESMEDDQIRRGVLKVEKDANRVKI